MKNFNQDFMPSEIEKFRKSLPKYNDDLEGTQFFNGVVGLKGVLDLSLRQSVLNTQSPCEDGEFYVTLRLYDEIDFPSFERSIHFKWTADTVLYRQSFSPSEQYPWGVSFLLVNVDSYYFYNGIKSQDKDFIYYEYKKAQFKNQMSRSILDNSDSNTEGHRNEATTTKVKKNIHTGEISSIE